MKLISALFVAALGLTVAAPGMAEQQSASTAKRAARPATKKTQQQKAEPAAHASQDAQGEDDEDDGKEPDITSSIATEFGCELGNKVTIYRNEGDDRHIALRWKKEVRRMRRVATTTGANRFENRRTGWVWIDIPAKGILLDARQGRQLANECRSPEQKAKAEELAKG